MITMQCVTRVFSFLLLLTAVSSCTQLPVKQSPKLICKWGTQQFDLCAYSDDSARVEALIAEMTLAEKLGQMTQSVWHNNVTPETIKTRFIGSIIHTDGPTPGPNATDWLDKFDTFQQQALQTRLGIPLLIGVDAVHGQNTFDGAVIFPHNIGMAATGNMSLIQRAAEITAIEAAGTGFNWTFSPCIAMPDHEHWGRVYEGFSEDLDLTMAATSASLRGYQGEHLEYRHTIAATTKHYLGDGATQGGVEGGNALISDSELRSRHLPTYINAIEQGTAAIMVGFNSVNGTPMHQHEYLVNQVLKQELGFEGVVLTDWNGGLRFGEPHTVINAGVDMAMQPANHDEFIQKLMLSVLDGTVSQTRIDDAVRRILRLKFQLGLFADPYAKREFAAQIGSQPHRQVARQAVRESLVLLKNENQALPLQPGEPLAVVGEHANNSGLQSGGWSIRWQGLNQNYAGATTIVEGIRQVSANVEYAVSGCHADMQARKVIAVVGEYPYAEGVGDSDQLWLSEQQQTMINQCHELDKQVIVVMLSGRALIVTPQLNQSDAFVAAWLPGSEGAGIADLLFATDGFTPRGKLPHAWPASVSDLPLSQNDRKALFPFGFGLQSY